MQADVDNFPFNRFKRYSGERLINKIAHHINNRSDLEQILNIYVRLGMIEAESIKIEEFRLDRYQKIDSFRVRIMNENNVDYIKIRVDHHGGMYVVIWLLIAIFITTTIYAVMT